MPAMCRGGLAAYGVEFRKPKSAGWLANTDAAASRLATSRS